MKSFKLFILAVLFQSCNVQSQVTTKDILNVISGSTSGFTNEEAVRALKEALTIGSSNSAGNASKPDGYYLNPLIKIPFPEEAKKMEETLNSLGFSKQTAEFIKTMNRAAEDAAKQAAPVFAKAITKMTITDGINIVKGSDNAATQYLINTTSISLKQAFAPIVKQSLQKVEITKYWNPLMTAYNQVPFVSPMNPNLDEYVTQKAIDGLFVLIAREELKIRKDPLARTTELLKRVFGSH
ncbi:MAG: DUF4197 domain-containing protein [Bacteroidia bacterium]|nr:DUF4197 domain-containing protein [Bacteroidia bacterium]MCZ2277165.1 DUF4197 domain-containing protein [Bacteroidia bacterium]